MGSSAQSLLPLKYEQSGWDALLSMAASHPDDSIRMEAAERLIRLGREFAPDLRGLVQTR